MISVVSARRTSSSAGDSTWVVVQAAQRARAGRTVTVLAPGPRTVRIRACPHLPRGLVHPWIGIEPVVRHDPVDQVVDDRGDVVHAPESLVERRCVLNSHRVPLFIIVFVATLVSTSRDQRRGGHQVRPADLTIFLLIASSVNEARWSVASVDGAQPPPGCSRERAPIARLTFATPEHRGQERRRRRRRSTAFYGGPGGLRPRPLRYRAQATGLRGLSVALAAARHTRMVRSPKLQCQSGRPALGSSRARLRNPASAEYPSQSSTGRDRRSGRCGGGEQHG
jgi:hypothetical protein